MSNEELSKLAGRYNLRVQILPSVVIVYSQINEWVIEMDHKNNIKLCHFNNPRKSCRTHAQIEFLSNTNTNNYDYVFKYIRGHDDSIVIGTKHLKSIK